MILLQHFFKFVTLQRLLTKNLNIYEKDKN